MKVQHIDHVAITVRDLKASCEWYARVLGLERTSPLGEDEPPQVMSAGDTAVALFTPSVNNPRQLTDDDRREQLGMRHFAFRVDRAGYDEAKAHFAALGLEMEEADHGICWSTYISDPDGHVIEVTTYEIG